MGSQDIVEARWFATELHVHEPMLRAWLQNRFPHLGEVDDVVQDAYAKVLLAVRDKAEVRSPKAFLFTTARNLAIDYLRKSQAARAGALGGLRELYVLEDSDDISETVARNEEIEIIKEAIQSLPRRCRQVVILRNVYGMAHKQIAEQLGISVRTVEAQLAIGVKLCTRFVARYGRR